jgi:hypothetical protein
MSDLGAGRAFVHEPRSRGALALLWGAATVFLVLLAFLALRVAAGQDPALRARAAATPLPARRVLVRRIYERRVIVHMPPSAPVRPTQASQQVTASGGAPSSAVTRTS